MKRFIKIILEQKRFEKTILYKLLNSYKKLYDYYTRQNSESIAYHKVYALNNGYKIKWYSHMVFVMYGKEVKEFYYFNHPKFSEIIKRLSTWNKKEL